MTKLNRALTALVICGLFTALNYAQTNPPQQGQGSNQGQSQQGQGQSQQGQGTGSTTGGGQTGTNTNGQREDPLAKLRDTVKGSQLQGNEKGITIDPIGVINSSVGSTVRFQARGRSTSMAATSAIIYSLNNGPLGSQIDPYSGWFSWTPTTPGSFSFDVNGADVTGVVKMGTARVVVNVEKKLEPFGYSFFLAPRAAIQARFLFLQSGMRAGIPILAGGSPGQGGLLPDGTPANNAMLSALRAMQGNSGFQLPSGSAGMTWFEWLNSLNNNPALSNPASNPNTGINNGNGQGDQSQGALGALGQGQIGNGGQNNGLGQGLGTNQGTGGNQGQGGQGQANQGQGQGNQGQGGQANGNGANTTLPPIQGPGYQPYNFGQDTSLVPQNRYSAPASPLLPTAQINPQTIDALRYMVGPFDMAGGQNVYVPSPDRYQLGPGDVLVIRYSSPTIEATEVTVAVDARGNVVLPPSGRKITVRGASLDKAERQIQAEMAKDIIKPTVSVSLKELRTMSLTIIGEAFMPGSYQVPAVATLFNALYMCGGPLETGSLRKIELRRTDGSKKTFDLYRFLMFGDASQDVPLQPGDTIYIPIAGARAKVEGEVGRPGIYEMLPGERLKDALRFAGEAKPTGVTQRIGQATVEPGVGLKLRDVDINGTGPDSNPPVYADDDIEVYSVRPVLTNVVTLEGAVDQPGQYALTQSMTVKSLIERARGTLPEANMARADLFRQNPDKTLELIPIDLGKALAGDAQNNVALRLYDRVRVYRVDEVQWMGERQVTVKGAVRRPGTYARADKMHVLDLLIQAGGLDGDAFQDQGFIQRMNPDDTMAELIRVDFRRAALGDSAHNVELKDRDTLVVQTVSEAQYVPEQKVRILGAVQNPGEYPSATNMHLRDLIQLAGGFMPEAGDKIEIAKARVSIGTPAQSLNINDVTAGTIDPILAPGDLVTIPARSDFQRTPRTVVIIGAVARPGPYAINSTTDKISDVIQRAGGLTPTAFARGAQFARDPEKLKTLFQNTLSPRVKEILDIINEDEYMRASARSEVEKARAAQQFNQKTPTISIPGLPSVSQGSTGTVQLEIKGDLVSRARNLRLSETEPAGNVAIRLEDALRNPNSPHNLVLQQGDIIVIPEKPSTVVIAGAVALAGSSVLFEPGKNLNFYLAKSGGLLPDAATNLIYVVRANGEVIKARGGTKIDLGDYIFVPTKVMAASLRDKQAEIDSISNRITTAAIVFSIIRAFAGG